MTTVDEMIGSIGDLDLKFIALNLEGRDKIEFAMFCTGCTHEEIGIRCGIDRSTVSKDLSRIINNVRTDRVRM